MSKITKEEFFAFRNIQQAFYTRIMQGLEPGQSIEDIIYSRETVKVRMGQLSKEIKWSHWNGLA